MPAPATSDAATSNAALPRIDQRTAIESITDELEKRLSDPDCRWHNDLPGYAATLDAAFPKMFSEDPQLNKDVAADRRRRHRVGIESGRIAE